MTLTIQPLREEQLPAAKAVITAGCFEFFGEPPADFADMDQLSLQYAPPSGIFLALLDGDQVVGTGAIRKIDDEICELKRMWFLPACRGQGYGTRMAERLLDFARSAGYTRVRLDTSLAMEAAIRLYRRLGFYPIERYNKGPAEIFMEMKL